MPEALTISRKKGVWPKPSKIEAYQELSGMLAKISGN
jgi:hypothetical protein